MAISIHALVKRATGALLPPYYSHSNFNPRPRKEGDHDSQHNADKACYFNPRPRKEGDMIPWYLCRPEYISIHALVKRATKRPQAVIIGHSISIHALVKRATSSTPPSLSHACISIHALVKRATRWQSCACFCG